MDGNKEPILLQKLFIVINRKEGALYAFICFNEYQHLTAININITVGWRYGSCGSYSALLFGHHHHHQDLEYSLA